MFRLLLQEDFVKKKSWLDLNYRHFTVKGMTTQPLWTPSENYFPAVRQLVTQAKLFERRPLWLLGQFILSIIGVGASVALATVVHHPLVTVATAVFAALCSLMAGYVMHDSGHRQSSRSTRVNDFLGFLSASSLGVSFYYWMDTHNEHHQNPNHEDDDPDVTVPLVAYSQRQVLDQRRAAFRWVITKQVWLYIPLLSLIPYSKRYWGLRYLIVEKRPVTRLMCLDAALVLVWHIVYYGGLLWILGPVHALWFSLVHQALIGCFFGAVFAPNHKGMPMIERGQNPDFFTKQVITARNFPAPRCIDFLFGGLNYQIEHHLFPNMPRYNLRRASIITKQFCRERNIPYYETSLFQSYYEVYALLRDVARFAQDLSQPASSLTRKWNAMYLKAERDLARFFERASERVGSTAQQQEHALAYRQMCNELAAMKQAESVEAKQDSETLASSLERLRQFMRQAKGRIA